MDRTFLRLDTNDNIDNVLHSNRVPGPITDPEVLLPNFIEVTDTTVPSGVVNWDDVAGHHYERSNGDITAPPPSPPTRLDELKGKPTWTQAEKDEAFELVLRRML